MPKIKLAFIISNLGQGGAERQFINLINGIDSEKFDVNLLLYAYQTDTFFNDLKIEKINLKKNTLRQTIIPFKIIEAIIYLRSYLREGNYDVVISTLFMNNFLVRVSSSNLYKNKIVANVRTSIKFYTYFHKLAEIFQIRNSFLIFNSKTTHKEFTKILPSRYHSRMKTIYNGFTTPVYNITVNNSNLGCLGRFSKEKNILQVVQAFKKLEKKINNSKLIIQGHKGDQYLEIKLVTKSTNRIEIRDKSPNVDTFYNDVSIIIIPSVFEGCPNVLFEAMLRRKLCIISEGANTDKFIINGINGFEYNGSIEDLEKMILIAIDALTILDGELMIENGYNYALKNFSLNTMVKQYEDLFSIIYENNKVSN